MDIDIHFTFTKIFRNLFIKTGFPEIKGTTEIIKRVSNVENDRSVYTRLSIMKMRCSEHILQIVIHNHIMCIRFISINADHSSTCSWRIIWRYFLSATHLKKITFACEFIYLSANFSAWIFNSVEIDIHTSFQQSVDEVNRDRNCTAQQVSIDAVR